MIPKILVTLMLACTIYGTGHANPHRKSPIELAKAELLQKYPDKTKVHK